MKLFSIVTSERGKPATKSSNEAIKITLTNERRQKFDIVFDGETLDIMSYFEAKHHLINYDENINRELKSTA